jgi:hypothetical protein
LFGRTRLYLSIISIHVKFVWYKSKILQHCVKNIFYIISWIFVIYLHLKVRSPIFNILLVIAPKLKRKILAVTDCCCTSHRYIISTEVAYIAKNYYNIRAWIVQSVYRRAKGWTAKVRFPAGVRFFSTP